MSDTNSQDSTSQDSTAQDPALSDGTVPDDADLKPVDEPDDEQNDGEPDPSTLTEDERDRELRHD